MGRSQRHLRAFAGEDSSGSTFFPGDDYTRDWTTTLPHNSGSVSHTYTADLTDAAAPTVTVTGSTLQANYSAAVTLAIDEGEPEVHVVAIPAGATNNEIAALLEALTIADVTLSRTDNVVTFTLDTGTAITTLTVARA